MKRGKPLKKIIHFNILVGMVFLYLIYRIRTESHTIDMIIMMEYFEGLIKIVLGVCGVILTWNTMKIKINKRANFLALCGLSISIFTIIKLGFYIKHNECTFILSITNQCRWIIEYLQILSLMIAVNYIDESRRLRIWTIIYGIICVGCVTLIYRTLSIPLKVLVYMDWTWMREFMGISCVILASMIYVMSYKKIRRLSPFERKTIGVLFGIKILVNALEGFDFIGNQAEIYTVYQMAQIIFSILVIGYIDELTLSITWKKIDKGVQNKNERVVRGYSDQKMLVTAAEEIQRLIEDINKQTFELENKMVLFHNNQHMKYIDKIKNNCLRLLKLSRNILDLNLHESDHKDYIFESINLTVLIGNIVESLETYVMQKEIQIVYTYSDECIMAEVDKEAIERLFLNLLSNAVKYNKVNGIIRVTLTKKKNQIYLCVQDTGIGIPNHYLDLIFEKFERVNTGLAREQEGSGLGLAIVKSLVDIHHGEIKIISKEDKGTLISVGLPVSQGERVDPIKCKTRNKESLNRKIQLELLGIER